MKRIVTLLAFIIVTCYSSVLGAVKLPAILTDSMVLQQSTTVSIWGWADPGEKISVTATWPKAEAVKTIAAQDGKWIVKIKTPKAGGPYDLSVTGATTILLHGVLIGEVWICSGQSNMEMPLKGWPGAPIMNSQEEIANATNPLIHLFTVKRNVAFSPADDVTGRWSACTPASAAEFSAIAYFFAKELTARLKIPVGLISTNWGGTVAEAWTSAGDLAPFKDFDQGLLKIDSMRNNAKAYALEDEQNLVALDAAMRNTDRHAAEPMFNDATWKTIELPGTWESNGYRDLDGIVWFRKEINVPACWVGKALWLDLGPVDDYDVAWFNGAVIDSSIEKRLKSSNRHYQVPGNLVKEGKNVIAIQVTDIGGNGGIYGNKQLLKLYPATATASDTIALAGTWKINVAYTQPKPRINMSPNQPSVLYNGMIAPLIQYVIRGAIWYQGEANVGRAAQYTSLFPAMIADWRKQWNLGEFPFYFVQIAPYKYGGDSTKAAALRDAQRRTIERSPNTGMVVTLDVGENNNIHPANKLDPGKRLSLWALNKTYKIKTGEYSGPLYKSMSSHNREAIVSFSNTTGGLTSKNKSLDNFEICGSGNVWKPATATISGNTVVLINSAVTAPTGVRYAWSATASASLFNGAGLPASSFSSEELK